MSNLNVSFLGMPTIMVDGQPFDTDRRKAIALLAYLVVNGKPQPRQQLAAFFWPDYDRDSAFAYLRRTLYELNKGLGAGWLITNRELAGFDATTAAVMDTQIFSTELAAARMSEDSLPHLEAAAAQYKGEFMAGFFLQDTEPFEDWLRLQRENFRGEYAAVLERLAAIYEQRGSWEAALKHALAWVTQDDLNEAAHRAVMRIYAGMGDRSRAIRQYETCARELQEELKARPQPETTALYERIREGSFGAAQQAEIRPPENRSSTESHFPVLATPFIGRRAEIEQLKELIQSATNRMVTLLGPGGIGKTRLSIQVATEISDRLKDGVWFVPLTTVQTVDGFFPAIAKALNFSFYREEESQRQQLLQFLRKKQLLLILDNLDHLISSEMADQVTDLLSATHNIKLLATSRGRLNIQAEQVFQVPGMRIPTPAEAAAWVDPESLAEPFSGLQLFLDKARRIQPGFTLNRENARVITEICQIVSGMPLGIELAASWLELLPPEDILSEIQRSLDFLETDQPDVPERQRSIRAVFDYSWKMLNEVERDVFLSLSVFIDSFSREAAQHVSGASLRTLLSLANKSWLQQVEGGRFQLHPLLQHYGLEKLRQNEAAWRNTKDRQAAFYAEFMAEQSQRMRSSEQLAALDELSKEFDTNVKSAWEWLVDQENWLELRQKMVMGLFQFGRIRSRGNELIRWMRIARQKLEHSSGSEEELSLMILGTAEVFFEESYFFKENKPEERLVLLWHMAEDEELAESMGIWFVLLGKIYTTRNNAPQAETRVEAAIERIRRQNDPWLLGIALLVQSYLWGQIPTGASIEKMSSCMQEALMIFRKLGTLYELGETISSMANIAVHKKLPVNEVTNLFDQARQIHAKFNNLESIGLIYWSLGNFYFSRGLPEEGFEAFHKHQRISEQTGNRRMSSAGLSWESIWATRYSTFEHAEETRRHSFEGLQHADDQTDYYWFIYELGEIYRIFGYLEKAVEYYEKARENFERISLNLGLGYYQRAMGDVAMLEGRYRDARQNYLAYQAYASRDNHTWSIAQASGKLAWVYAHMGEIEPSRGNLYSCLKQLENADEAGLELMALLSEARCLAEEGNIEPATALATYIKSHPITWNETRMLAKGLLAELAKKQGTEPFEETSLQLQQLSVQELTRRWLETHETTGNKTTYAQF